jgi:hypothetical protein
MQRRWQQERSVADHSGGAVSAQVLQVRIPLGSRVLFAKFAAKGVLCGVTARQVEANLWASPMAYCAKWCNGRVEKAFVQLYLRRAHMR